MSNSDDSKRKDTKSEFERAATEKPPTLVGEFTSWLAHNKKWWLAPVLVVTLLLGLILVLEGTALGSWIYALL